MNTSVRRVSITSTPGCFNSSCSSRSATSSTRSASFRSLPARRGRGRRGPGSMTTRAMPSPSWRDSEKRPSRLTDGVPLRAGAPATASVIASVFRVGSGASAAGRREPAFPDARVRDDGSAGGCSGGRRRLRVGGRRRARHRHLAVTAGSGSPPRSRPAPAWRRRQLAVDHEAVRVVQREHGVPRGAVHLEHHARAVVGPLPHADLPHRAVR